MAYNFSKWRQTADKHVVMLSNHCCIRVQKQAQALKDRGWRVDSVSLRRPSDVTCFTNAYVAKPHNVVRPLRDCGAKLIHVHNEPDSLMRVADQACEGRPIVYDCHDLESNRYGFVGDDEMYAFARADGVISVSSAHRDVAYGLHPWDAPEAVTMSLPMRKRKPTAVAQRSGVVYQGGIAPPGKCAWRDLSVPVAEFWQAGIDFDLYSKTGLSKWYPGAKPFLDYQLLLETLTRYSFGFCGHDPAHEVYKTAMPNKVWEYAMCGVIPLFVNLDHAAEVFGAGIVATSTRDAIAQIRECDEDAMRAEVYAKARYMDDEIVNTIDLYERLL